MLVEEKFSTNEHKPFYRHWTGLRDALEHLTNTGDFQDGRMLCCELVVTFHGATDAAGKRWRKFSYQKSLDATNPMLTDLFIAETDKDYNSYLDAENACYGYDD